MRNLTIAATFLFLFFGGGGALEAVTIDFEGQGDLTGITDQYSSVGVTFSHATVLTAGISLNRFEFPPRSGRNVIYDDGGPMTLTFNDPVADFEGHFTYALPLFLSFYDLRGHEIGNETSRFYSNTAHSGDPGSEPNELLSFSRPLGIARVIITADLFGNSFTLDDLTFIPLSIQVPEPPPFFILAAGLLFLAYWGCYGLGNGRGRMWR